MKKTFVEFYYSHCNQKKESFQKFNDGDIIFPHMESFDEKESILHYFEC
jgi:hypothetical protein